MTGQRSRRLCCLGLLALLGAACASSKPAARIDDGALARLNEQQMAPVDQARIEEGRARDQVARSRAAVQDAKAKVEVARAEQDVAQAQQKRAQAEAQMLQRQKADPRDVQRAQQDAQIAAERVRVAGLKIDYLGRLVGISELEEQLAAQHVQVVQVATERAKFQALHDVSSSEVRGMNGATIDARLADAQAKEAQLRKEDADRRVELLDSYNKWQELDARLRNLPQQPGRLTPPPPTTSAPAAPPPVR